jgi:hypothetical protein
MINIADPALWGNEAADDEDPATLESYFVSQPKFSRFFDTRRPFSIARARKGLGKSALLKLGAYHLRDLPRVMVVELKGADLAALRPVKPMSPEEHLYDWQQRMCMVINRELGNRIGLATSDDTITMVESAELAGWKQRNLVGVLLDRLVGKLGPAQLTKLEVKDHRALLQRHQRLSKESTVWLFIDDIDATFLRSNDESLRLSTFFSACRALVSGFKSIHIRTCVRSDVWASIRKTDESLDKCEQYIFDIQWSQRQTGVILAERITAYVGRDDRRPRSLPARSTSSGEGEPNRTVLDRVFAPTFPWGTGQRPAYVVIHTYSAGRPRWAAQLCRMAAEEAISVRDRQIKFGHVKQVLVEYGRFRLDDITREHKHQCPEIAAVANAFSRGTYRYSTAELLKFIETKILRNTTVTIEGERPTMPMPVAHFLFRIGFVVGCERGGSGGTRYYTYEEKPDLLLNEANIDDGLDWQIHPSFQAALSVE